MALDIEPNRFIDPIATDLPCGDDLDEAGDPDFVNGLARAESRLPSFYLFRDGGELKVFDRSNIDFARESELLLDLLHRTRDLRLLVLLGRLTMLDRDLRGFGQVLTAVAGLLEARWDDVHPRGAGDDYDFRAAVLQALEDNPTVILPLQHTTLFRSRRFGPIAFRNLMVATGEVPPASQDPGPDRAAITRALEDAEPDALEATRVDLATVLDAISRIRAVTLSRGGGSGAVDLERLRELVERMRVFAGATAAPPAVSGTPEPAPAAPASVHGPTVGAITSTGQAASALAAAALYLRNHEPSSPAEVLVRQAQTLVGKSFVEVMRILMPDRAPDVAIVLGAGRKLRLTFDQLAAVPDGGGADQGSDPGLDQDRDATAASDTPAFRAATRGEAVALLREAGEHFRRSEPASPIPLLLEKAASLADRDFLAVLKDVLSDAGSD